MDEIIDIDDRMAEKFGLTYFYVTPENADRLEAFRVCTGDSEKSLITQYVRGWLGRNRQHYLDLARLDAKARDISFKRWGEITVSYGIEALPLYKGEIKDIPIDPLRDVQLPPSTIRKSINYITLGKQNLALLRVGIHYDRDNAIGYVSRIVKEHLDRNWATLYKFQVEAENFENWS